MGKEREREEKETRNSFHRLNRGVQRRFIDDSREGQVNEDGVVREKEGGIRERERERESRGVTKR